MPLCLDGFRRLPIPRQQFVEPIDWVSIDHSLEHVAQVGVGIDLVHFGGFDERADGGPRSPPPSDPANKYSSDRGLLPVHSAHVGQELEVHYRYHPYFGCKVLVRRVEQRATGQFF